MSAPSVASVAKISASLVFSLAPKGAGGCPVAAGEPPAPKQNLKETDVVDMMMSGF